MISDLTPVNTVLEPLHHTVSDFRTGCSELEKVLDDMFQEMDRLRMNLVSRMGELDQKQARLEDQDEQLGQHREEIAVLKGELNQRDAQWELAQNEWSTTSEELTSQAERAQHESGTALDELQQQLVIAEQERDLLREQIDKSQAELARTADVEVELAETRRELIEAQELARQNAGNLSAAEQSPADSDDLVQLTQERDALEEELELVRSRASELTETVAAQKRKMVDREAGTANELQRLGQLVERQAELMAGGSIPQADDHEPAEKPCDPNPKENDAVVSSVMAQFAKLHKDVSQRRQRSK